MWDLFLLLISLQTKEEESRRLRGEEMDAMLMDRDRKLAEKEAYIIHLQMALPGEQQQARGDGLQPGSSPQTSEASGELQELVHSLTRKVGESEERYSLLQEQAESLKELLLTEKEQFTRKENMYKENVGLLRELQPVWLSASSLTCALLHVPSDPDLQGHHHPEGQPADADQPDARAGTLQASCQV